jgi:hypothetical protein
MSCLRLCCRLASVARTSTLLGICFETCRCETCSNAVRPAACVQVLNCIDYLHKFGYSKEQVSGGPASDMLRSTV